MLRIIAGVIALAAFAMAAPNAGCTPATYLCATNPVSGSPGWQICDVSGNWVYGGDCPPYTQCFFNSVNKSPYCI